MGLPELAGHLPRPVFHSCHHRESGALCPHSLTFLCNLLAFPDLYVQMFTFYCTDISPLVHFINWSNKLHNAGNHYSYDQYIPSFFVASYTLCSNHRVTVFVHDAVINAKVSVGLYSITIKFCLIMWSTVLLSKTNPSQPSPLKQGCVQYKPHTSWISV